MEHAVHLEFYRTGKDEVVVNIVFLETGEIRQKRRSVQWLADRIFFHEKRSRGDTYKVQCSSVRDDTIEELLT